MITIGPDWDASIACAPSGPPDITVSGSDVGLIIYTGGTTGQATQVVELGATDLTEANDFDPLDAWGVDKERALNTDAV